MPTTRKRSRMEIPEALPPSRKRGELGEEINEDDLCPICHLLVCHPVTTRCNHTMCNSCMAHWADVSISTAMMTVDINEMLTTSSIAPNQIEARCPMCRTQTTALPNGRLESTLRRKYQEAYRAREAEERAGQEDPDGTEIDTLTVYIGNTHRLVEVDDGEAANRHEWVFFVRPERADLIEEVQVFLHPTFRNSHIILQHPPYTISRLGWGVFNIFTHVILKAGYSWVSSEAEDAPDGGEKGVLPLEWMLSFDGDGSQARLRLKIKKQKEGIDDEVQRQSERARRLWAEQRRADPDFEPPVDEG